MTFHPRGPGRSRPDIRPIGEDVFTLHAPTLFLMLTAVTLMTGGLLLASWLQNREVRPLMWWAIANLVGAATTTLFGMRNAAPNFLTIDVANTMLVLSFALCWVGFRLFCNRPVNWIIVVAPAIALFALYQWPAFYASMTARITAASIAPAAFSLAMAWELYRLAPERLVSRYLAIGWLLIHTLSFAVRPAIAFFVQAPPTDGIVVTPWFSLIAFEALLNVIALAFLQIAMIRERAENLQRKAALTDALTGAPNRRGVLDEAARLMREAKASGHPLCALQIDIDHFKSINDRFGHDGGDAVLIGVADVMRAHLRREDAFGRLGGEEFVCFLPNTSIGAAATVAEGLRARVAGLRMTSGGQEVRVSVSIGIAASDGGHADPAALLREADRNLYEAKSNGRNRIATTGTQPPRPQLRIA